MADRQKLKSIAAGLVILLSGMAIGSSLSLNVMWRRFIHNLRKPAPEVAIADMKRHLDLSDQQAEKILAIMNENKTEMEELHKKIVEQTRAKITELRNRIAAEITPEQAEKFTKRFDRVEKDMHHPPPPK